jgi:hypothetical protein
MSIQDPNRGLLTIILLAAAGLFLTAASIEPVGLGQSAASITVSPGHGPPGTNATVTGSGFPGAQNGKILWDSSSGAQIGSFTTNGNGAFSTGVAFPANAPSGGHVIWACTTSIKLIAGPVCASQGVKVTESPTRVPTLVPVTRAPPTPVPSECDARGLAGEVVINFEGYASGTNLRGTSSPEGIRFLGDSNMPVVSPSVATHSGTKALSMDYPGEFGSNGIPMRIGFTNLQDFVGLYVGLNERIWSTSPITAVLTAYSLDVSGHRVVAGTDSVSFGPAATPIRKCLSVSAPGIFEITVNYGSVGEPEIIDDLTLRGPATSVPVPGDDQSPRITILLPEAGATFTSPYVRLQGEVREDRELASMNYQLRAGSFHDLAFTPAGVTPEGDRLYLFAVDPLPVSELTACGENTVQVRAYDTSDNIGGADQTFRIMAGDLSIVGAEPVQVVYGADLVREKGTAFRVRVRSTFTCPVETQLLLDLPEDEWSSGPVGSGDYHIGLPPGYEYPDTWGPVTIPAWAEDFAVMLPHVPEGQETEGFGDAVAAGLVRTLDNLNPDVRVLPRPVADEVRFAIEIDPENSLPEQDEANNRFDSPPLRAVTTRPYTFVAFQTRVIEEDGTCTPTMAQVQTAFKPAVEYVLGVFPIADAKISAEISSEQQTWDTTSEDRAPFLARIDELAKSFGGDFGVAMTCDGGGTSGGDAVFVGVNTVEETLAHEFNHVVVPMGDVYSLDCYCNWGESYCQLPDGDRFYCCYDESYNGSEDWVSARATEEAMGVDSMQGCTLDCGQNETVGWSSATCYSECEVACTGVGGTRYWCPDGRTSELRILLASDGFWPNRWSREEGKLYFMDGPTGDNWMILESMQALGEVTCWDSDGIDINGYADLLLNPRFRNDDDPAALLVSGSITKDGQATLLPFLVLPEAFLDRAPGSTGNYTFVLKDDAGHVLSRTGFDLAFWQSDPNGGPLNEAHFVLRIEWVDGTSRIELLDQTGSLLASRDVTPGAPVVEIADPAGGSVTAAKSVTIRWMASDPDGDDLVYSLALSADGGETWQPVAGRLEKESYPLPVSAFAEGATYLVKVLATDGVNTGSAVSATPFSVVVGTPKTTLYAMIVGLVALGVAGAVLIVLALWPKKGRRAG